MLALERRRLENRSREEGPGSARDETVGVAETPYPYGTCEEAAWSSCLILLRRIPRSLAYSAEAAAKAGLRGASFVRSRFEEPNRLKKLHEPARRHALRHVGFHDLTLSLLFSVCFCFLRFFRWKYLKLLERVWSFARYFSGETS